MFSFTGGIADTPCPYKCISDRYHMPHCYTALEELIYTFGGPWLFGLFLVGLLILLALVLSVARMKFVGVDELPGPAPTQHGSQIDHSFPFLESLNEVFLKIGGSFSIQLLKPLWVKMVTILTSSIFSSFLFFCYLLVMIVMSCYPMARLWKQTGLRNLRVMCIDCTLWDQILSVNLAFDLAVHGLSMRGLR